MLRRGCWVFHLLASPLCSLIPFRLQLIIPHISTAPPPVRPVMAVYHAHASQLPHTCGGCFPSACPKISTQETYSGSSGGQVNQIAVSVHDPYNITDRTTFLCQRMYPLSWIPGAFVVYVVSWIAPTHCASPCPHCAAASLVRQSDSVPRTPRSYTPNCLHATTGQAPPASYSSARPPVMPLLGSISVLAVRSKPGTWVLLAMLPLSPQ